MQFLERAGGYVYNQFALLNPATLSGAIDVVVIEQPDGTLHCLPFHVRFGLLQILKPSHKKVELYVNGMKTNLPMKLGDEGEAFFVFEADGTLGDQLLKLVLTLPLLAPLLEALLPQLAAAGGDSDPPEPLTLNLDENDDVNNVDDRIELTDDEPKMPALPRLPRSPLLEHVQEVTKKLNIPSKVDVNGDIVLDMDGYKPLSQKNIENLNENFQKMFVDEISKLKLLELDDYGVDVWDQIIHRDDDGTIRILNQDENPNYGGLSPNQMPQDHQTPAPPARTTTHCNDQDPGKTYFKTLRLTLDQLQHLGLQYGENHLRFKVAYGLTAEVEALCFLWKLNIPIVISDIDGTITKLDALGHIMNLVGRDWTHPGVARLFQDIRQNGYNIIYLTARLVGQLDATRQYLKGISQDMNTRLPAGPVLLSPDRTFAALKREVILKQPEVFKMACLQDIKRLYYSPEEVVPTNDLDDMRTPFYAGFGNRITDAISYRSVQIPLHRIFTINPNGEVHMELLELAGLHSSYLKIGEIVDLFFPPLREATTFAIMDNRLQYNQYLDHKKNQEDEQPKLPPGERFVPIDMDERFTDLNYWHTKPDIDNLTDLSDDDDGGKLVPLLPPRSPRLWGRSGAALLELVNLIPSPAKLLSESPLKLARPTSMGFAPLKNFMSFGGLLLKKDGHHLDDEYDELEFLDAQQTFHMPGQFDDSTEDDFTGELEADEEDDEDDEEEDEEEEDDHDYEEEEDHDYEDDDDIDDIDNNGDHHHHIHDNTPHNHPGLGSAQPTTNSADDTATTT